MDERWDELWTNTLKPWLDDQRIEIGTGALSLVAEIATPNGIRRLT